MESVVVVWQVTRFAITRVQRTDGVMISLCVCEGVEHRNARRDQVRDQREGHDERASESGWRSACEGHGTRTYRDPLARVKLNRRHSGLPRSPLRGINPAARAAHSR
jgi:hypothetical protein